MGVSGFSKSEHGGSGLWGPFSLGSSCAGREVIGLFGLRGLGV